MDLYAYLKLNKGGGTGESQNQQAFKTRRWRIPQHYGDFLRSNADIGTVFSVSG